MASKRKLRKQFAHDYLGASPILSFLPPSVKRRTAHIRTLIIDTDNLTNGTYRFDRYLPFSHSITEVSDAAQRALAGNTSAYAAELRAALPQQAVSSNAPVDSGASPCFHTTWHHGSEYQTYWLGDPTIMFSHADLTENERERLELAARKANATGAYAYAVGRSIHAQALKQTLPSIEVYGLVIVYPRLHTGTEQAIGRLKQWGIDIIYASSSPIQQVEALSHAARLGAHNVPPARRTAGGLPLDQPLYANLTAADRRRIVSHYPTDSTLRVQHSLPEFCQMFQAVIQ